MICTDSLRYIIRNMASVTSIIECLMEAERVEVNPDEIWRGLPARAPSWLAFPENLSSIWAPHHNVEAFMSMGLIPVERDDRFS
jgi:hypothetical protein